MDGNCVIVDCRDCSFRRACSGLPEARSVLDAHEQDTGHGVDWQIGGVAQGVERAGADAGVCGRPECANGDSPLVRCRNRYDTR